MQTKHFSGNQTFYFNKKLYLVQKKVYLNVYFYIVIFYENEQTLRVCDNSISDKFGQYKFNTLLNQFKILFNLFPAESASIC